MVSTTTDNAKALQTIGFWGLGQPAIMSTLDAAITGAIVVGCMTSGCVVLDMRLRIEHQRPIERVKTW
jgi:hypothetical protein